VATSRVRPGFGEWPARMNSCLMKQLVCATLIGGLSVAGGAAAQGAPGTPITSNLHERTAYPRLIRLQYGPGEGTILASVAPGAFYESTDDGGAITKVTDLRLRPEAAWKCCGTLFELPRQVGRLQPGTLLFAATFCVGSTASIDVYSSSDEARTWTYHSTPVQRGDCDARKRDGLWEPEFEIDSGGSLVMFWSDETDPCCSQKLSQIQSIDGVSWQHEKNTVATHVRADRPGMAVVSKLPSGMYFMSYELCGPAKCAVYSRTSKDGWNFGPPAGEGRKIETAAGEYFEHAPSNHWIPGSNNQSTPNSPSDNGALMIVGQLLYKKNGEISPNSGKVLLLNRTKDASGKWEMMPAPIQVSVTAVPYNTCQNYSSALLPDRNGIALLEMASDFNPINVCTSYFARESIH
jgi:hypothetical protein